MDKVTLDQRTEESENAWSKQDLGRGKCRRSGSGKFEEQS